MSHAGCEYISLPYVEEQLYYHVFPMPHKIMFKLMFSDIINK